jgi:putative ABC transport system permease protein
VSGRLVALRSRLRSAFVRRRIDEDARRELDAHLDLLIERCVRLGMTPADARNAARRQLGNALLVREEIHDMNGVRWLEQLWSDLRIAIRQLRSSPGFTALAVITLALGIGANSAIFALVDAALIRPLPFPEADRLVMVWERTARFSRGPVAPLTFHDWHARNRSFDAMAAVFNYPRRLSTPDGHVEQIPAQQVTPRFFDLLGARLVAGRTFLASDVTVPPNVVMLSEGLWRSRFGGDPAVVGQIIQLDTQPFTVVGVVAADFQGIPPASLWTVWAELPGMNARAGRFMRVVGRLKPGLTLESAQSDLERVAAELAREYPVTNKDTSVTIDPLREALVGRDIRSTSILFLGVVGFVLLMCCVNVANLLLVRTAGRARELALRAAMGAGRPRIVRQLLTESVVLGTIGGMLGLVIAAVILRSAPSVIPQGLLPPVVVLNFDVRVAWFCAVTAFTVGIVFGVAPAWQATRTSLVEALASDGRGTTRGGSRLRNLLVIGEVATAVLLLCGAGLLLRTLVALGNVDAGHRADDVLAVQPSLSYGLPTSTFGSEDALRQFLERVEREVTSLPSVASAGWGTSLPLAGFNPLPLEIIGDQPDSPTTRVLADGQIVSPGYLPTLGVPILAGRAFTEQDTANSPPVCIVSEALVQQHFGGRNPIGMRLLVPRLSVGATAAVVREIVGVAGNVRRDLGEVEESRSVYVPIAQNPWSITILLVKPSTGRAEVLAPAVRGAIAGVDRRVPVAQVRTLEEIMRQFTARPRFRAVMVTTFAALALVLAMVGVFGVLAYSVHQRRREFGVRIALGASTASVLRLVCGSAGRLIGTGALLGLVLAALFAQSISAFLFGVQALDPLTFAGVIVVLGATAAIASAIPALRASQVDPAVAFRSD